MNDVPEEAAAATTATCCRILYSTQSGRAKACARRTARILAERHGGAVLQNGTGTTVDLDEWNEDAKNGGVAQLARRLHESRALLLLFVSTTGDGEHTDTIQRTWKNLLQKSLPKDTFQGVRFCIFSLGDRAYGPQKFCAAGRKLTVRLRQLGAVLQEEPGFGDDGTPNGGCFADLDQWLETTLLPCVQTTIPTATATTTTTIPLPACSSSLSPPYVVEILTESKVDKEKQQNLEEWQLERYVESYQTFFDRQRPLSAYSYNVGSNHHGRIVGANGTSNSNGSTYQQLLVGRVTQNRRLTADDWEQNTFHFRIEVPSLATTETTKDGDNNTVLAESASLEDHLNALPYRAGDVAAILPSNTTKEVAAFLKVLPQNLQDMADFELSIRFDSLSSDTQQQQHFFGHGYSNWPSLCTFRGWLTHCADLHGLPEREDLRALATYCSLEHERGPDQRDKLVSLSETKASALYADYILREKRSWRDVLYDFDSLRDAGSRLTLEALLGLLPPIRYREFSIASSPSKERETLSKATSAASSISIELCVAVVEGTTRLGRSYHGLCSHYLSQRSEGTSMVRLWIRPGSFHGLPLQISPGSTMPPPILYVGAGTGVAPLRSLILERDVLLPATSTNGYTLDKDNDNELQRSDILVFGCRKRESDFYYDAEWNSLRQSGRLGLLTAFSRDQWHKIYVQQVIEKADKEQRIISSLVLERSGSVYIAGGPLMARAVKEAIVESLAKEVGGDEKQAQRILSKMQQAGRFSVEAWN